MLRLLLVVFLFFIVDAAQAAAIERFKAFAKGTQTARGSLEQKVYDRDGGLSQESKGSFAFQRPGKVRRLYDRPVDQVIVGHGDRVWIYDRGLAPLTDR